MINVFFLKKSIKKEHKKPPEPIDQTRDLNHEIGITS